MLVRRMRRKDGNVSIYNANFAGYSGKDMSINNTAEYIKEARAKFDSYGSEWEKAYFNDSSGGYVVVHKGHKFDVETGKYEIKTAHISSDNGYMVEMMDESNFEKPQYDINVNGFPTEIKAMRGFRNIHKRAEDAAYQDAKRIVYYIRFDNDKEMFKRFINVFRTVYKIEEIWYIKNDRLHYFKK